MTEETSGNVATMSSEDVPAGEEVSDTAKVPEDYQDVLAEYEAEFMHRYTEKDPNFQSYLSKELDPPPIVENFYSGQPSRGGDSRNRHYQQGHKRRYEGGGGYDRNYDRRQQHNQYNRHYNRQYDRQHDRHRHTQRYHERNYEDRRQPNYQQRGGRDGGWT